MNQRLAKYSCLLAIVLFVAVTLGRTHPPPDKVVQAANQFLATLTPEQKQKVVYAFDDNDQRARWSNFPTGFVPRGGMSLKQMTSQQRAAALNLLTVVLSPMGYGKVNEIRLADDDFKVNGSKRGPRGGGPPPNGPTPGGGSGGPPPPFPGARAGGPGARPPTGEMFGSDLYYISFLGTPSTNIPWMLQFGGHHLALNITVAGSAGVLTPTLTGAQPATFHLNGKTIRPIGRESDKALALFQSLDEKQRRLAVLAYSVPDLVLGPGQDGKKITPEGLKASELNDTQACDVAGVDRGVGQHHQRVCRHSSHRRTQRDLNETWFAWSGPTTFPSGTNITAYYRIQGPHLVIEYAPQHDEPANHVHTIYRDPTNDYGSQLNGR
ncbi:MAG: DUF3500 domain-containing protein [Acidobacteriaceae bacterium]|nr:DUF3500 domain-containing protein [Acidobacteriaceae bacterium]